MEYRQIAIGEYCGEYAVYGYGQMMGDMYILHTGTREECNQWVVANGYEYLLDED